MKHGLKKLMSLVIAAAMLLSIASPNVFASEAEPLPTVLDAPTVVLYDSGSWTLDLRVKTRHPESILDIYEKGYTNREDNPDGYGYISDYGDTYLYGAYIQYDWKIDDGQWHYTEEWDDSYYNADYTGYFNGGVVDWTYIGSVSSYYMDELGQALSDGGCLIETTDGSSTYWRFDTENHSISIRARYMLYFMDTEYNAQVVSSDWSQTAVYGGGSLPENTVPMTLSAPVIDNQEIYNTDTYYGSPETRFEVYHGEDIIDALMWIDDYTSDLESSTMELVLEASLDPNFGEGSTVVKTTVSTSSSLKRQISWDMMFYNLWYELPGSDQQAFVWNGETVYMRAKWVNERKVSGQWSTIESPYSNVLSVQGPEVESYTVTITHDAYGFDSEYNDALIVRKITEGKKHGSISTYPLEGCYVDTVTVNGVVMYDHDDESTYELLDWWGNYKYFEFLEEDIYATEDLDIQITYGGTPTAKYGITTEYGNGGYLYTYSNYDSWDDNSLVVYHGTEPRIYISPDSGFVIDSVLIDGVENEEAKVNGYYDFPAITDNGHSIEVTFRREAYRISYYASWNGSISTDYQWYQDMDGYVRIGDDITFTFTPDQDESGNYYEIDKVYVDYVVNDEAKTSGSYTFTDVQASHDLDVYFSEDPVITHDVTATSGENGSISPEGVVHVREGSTYRFEFLPDDGYEVDQVFVDGVEITNLATKEYYNIADVTQEHTIHVTFKKLPVQYDVNVIVSGHNTDVHSVSPRGVTPVWEGEGFAVTFAPFAGYQVEKVLVNGTPVQADGTYAIEAVNADTTIEIFFKIKSYTVTFVDHDGTELKKETVEHGAQATAPADPVREHYVFTGWDTDFSGVTTNVTIRATYRLAEYTVKFMGWDGSLLKTETVTYGGSAVAPEAPDREGYDFSHWSLDYTNVSANIEVTAVYTQKEYTVTFVDSDDTVLSTQTVKHGEAAAAPVSPTREGYTFVGWDTSEYGRVTRDLTVKAMYVEGTGVTYTVTSRALGNSGSVSPIGVTTVQENGSLTLTFTPSELSRIVKVLVDGQQIEVCDSYTFENITANHTIDVYFAPTAVINVAGGDTQQGTAAGHYDLLGDELVYILDVTPAEGYELDGIYANGVKLDLETLGGSYVIRDLTAGLELDIRFKLTAPEGGGEPPVNEPPVEEPPVDVPPKTGDGMLLYLCLGATAAMGMALLLSGKEKDRYIPE